MNIPLPYQSSAIRLQTIASRLVADHDVHLSVLRLDNIHAEISGNKWFKLLPVLQAARESGQSLLSFGGAWSNHVHALAYAGHCLGIKTIGVIRGEPEYADNAMLSDAQRWGMRLHFVSRSEYRQRHEMKYHDQLRQQHGPVQVIPEGGATLEAVHSVQSIWQLPALAGEACDYLVTAVGTGSTLAGLVAGRPEHAHVLGVPVLKYDQRLIQDVRTWLQLQGVDPEAGWSLLPDAHQGGYARLGAELARTLRVLEAGFDLPLDPVYTGKAMMALMRAVLQGNIPSGSRVVFLHTGGLQGRRGMTQRLSVLAPDFTGPLAL
ncbi:1-aminocyclopropane-1-carboxylate deaminase [Marinobacterium halophilum]|uniref:1-aminocyclopropane-1-carboxylate deaminase n=1 Tax=Marinobacterium halophilum TaxID=267374 RepID=A0A2P8EUS3_9GAMM|nr:pyridoxal-phosphate dependent enzyme [Marinobacterium halophilum]PSL13223.1 1-aminocyclopropane-1-carboxylate deaminase [Marinobacterium halophilum]